MYKKILVTLDGTELSKQALPHAQALAEQFDAELTLLRVAPDIPQMIQAEYSDPMGFHFASLADEQQQLVDDATASLQGLADNLKLHKINAVASVEVGKAANRIIDYATSNASDLIVMSTHDRTGVSRLVYGSVAAEVLHNAPCPVLLVHPT